MTDHFASALPRKRFFLEMFTRDISLDACVLDLVDNSIDGLLRSRYPLLSAPSLMQERLPTGPALSELPTIDIKYDQRRFEITDDCGGITLHEAETEVFNFGYAHDHAAQPGRLGVYGVGLKRAIFKIGRQVRIISRAAESGFQLDLDVGAWAAKDDSLEDWQLPIAALPGSPTSQGTTVSVSNLRDEVVQRFRSTVFETRLARQIARTYLLFLDRVVRVRLNGSWIRPFANPLGESQEVTLASDSFKQDGVSVMLFAGLAARDPGGEWSAETAGWYVFCTGRAIAVADKSPITGWGVGRVLPQFHPKYRGFVGLAFFDADDPLKLPWATTKQTVNQESAIYQACLSRMKGLARPVITFLDQMYRGEAREETELRRVASEVKSLDSGALAAPRKAGAFKWTPPPRPVKTTVSVQFEAEIRDIEAIRKHLRKAKMPYGRIGAHCLEYFLKAEGLLP